MMRALIVPIFINGERIKCKEQCQVHTGEEDHARHGWTTSRRSIRMTEDIDKWRKYVHGVANPRIEDG